MVQWLGHGTVTAEARVQFSLEPPIKWAGSVTFCYKSNYDIKHFSPKPIT